MPRIPNRRDDDREPISPGPATPIAEAAPPPAAPLVAPPAAGEGGDPATTDMADIADVAAAAPPPTTSLPPIVPTEAHEAEADLLLAAAENPPRAAPARGWRADAQRIYRMVSDELLLVTAGKRLPTIEEIDRAIEGAVARSAPRREDAQGETMPGADIRNAAMRRFAEADDVDMRNASAIDDEAAPDWLDQQRTGLAAQTMEDAENSAPESADGRITAIINPPEMASSELPSDVDAPLADSASIARTVAPIDVDMRSLPNLAYLDRLRQDLSDPVASKRYVSNIGKTPARLNNIILNLSDYLMATQDGLWRNLKGIASSNGAFNGNQDALNAGLISRQDAINRLNNEPNLQSITGQPDVRAFVAGIAKMTAKAKLKGGQDYEKYLVVGRRQSDGELVVVAIGAGGTQGGSFADLAGAGGKQMPKGITFVAIIHTHPESVEPQPYDGDPDGVWRKDVPVYTISMKGKLQIFETTRRVTHPVVNGKVQPFGETIQHTIDANGVAGNPQVLKWPYR